MGGPQRKINGGGQPDMPRHKCLWAYVPKIPQSHVTSFMALKKKVKNSAKTHNYNLQGNMDLKVDRPFPRNKKRHWVLNFASKHFTDNDILVVRDDLWNHTTLGPYDYTNVEFHTSDKIVNNFDASYYEIMVQS